MREHVLVLKQLSVDVRLVRESVDLEGLDGIILPGGESTAQSKLLQIFDLLEPLKQKLKAGMPALATCAGLILLAKQVEGLVIGQKTLEQLDARIQRNGYGSQLDSFEATIEFLGERMRVAFIRAPKILDPGSSEVLATWQGEPVIIREGNLIAATCHPEVTGDASLHREFLQMCRRNQLVI